MGKLMINSKLDEAATIFSNQSVDQLDSGSGYEGYASIIQGVLRLLEERYGCTFQLYMNDGRSEEYWELLEQDIMNGSPIVDYVARIFEHVESRAFKYDTELPSGGSSLDSKELRMFPTLRNNVFAYPERGVAFARVPMFRLHGIYSEDFVFAASDGSMREFLEYTRKRRRELDRSQVTVFTDGPNGVDRELVPMNGLIHREDVMLQDSVKTDIFRSIDRFFAEDRSFYMEHRIPYKRGILLYGKPGNGKTTLVKSIAGSVPAPVAYWQMTEHTCSSTIQEVFEAAVHMAPMILVIEDMDSMPEAVRSYFLNTLDGATSREGIFLIGTTNFPEKIDPALMNRAGRFDRAYEIKLPDAELRLRYLERKGIFKFGNREDAAEISRLTEGCTFAQLNELYAAAALEWHYEGRSDLKELVNKLKNDLHKGRSLPWMQEDAAPRAGFIHAG